MKSLALLGAVAIFTLSACGTKQIKLGSYDFQFCPRTHIALHGGSEDGTAGDVDMVTTSRKVIRIRDGHLFMNTRAYGALEPGSSIEVQQGSLLVNGVKREARPLSRKDLQTLTMSEEFQGRIGALQVTTRPGIPSLGSSQAEYSNDEELTCVFGLTPVTIGRRGQLWVNGIRYHRPRGFKSIIDAKTLVIDDARVTVDGEKWSPAIKG